MRLLDDEDDPVFRSDLDNAVHASTQFDHGAIAEKVKHLAAQYDRHVICVQFAFSELPASNPASRKVNCHAFSLSLYKTLAFQTAQVFPDSDFLEHLISREILIARPICDALDRDLLVYRRGNRITHSGLLAGGFLHSKWGEGSLFEHTRLAVPARYGSDFQLFQEPSVEKVTALYASRW